MFHRTLMAGLLAALLAAPALAAGDEREDRLPEPYRTWLKEEVTYIITDVEREAFLRLESNEERDAFIEAFWRKRDTNPATPENEYREEHYRRLAYVNEFFGRDTFRKGWQTDRGRFYILLGPPRDIQNFESKDEIYPAELWFYNNPELKRLGLPPFFYLLFFRRHGVGELELYSPIADGPQALLTGYQTISMDFRQDIERAYNKLYEISPELAQASISFRTDEGDIVQFQSPSFGTVSLLEQIVNSPFRGVDTSYAERFDVERGLVEADYLFSYVPSWGMMNVLPGPDGVAYLHWVIEIDPQHIAVVHDVDRGVYGSVFISSVEVVLRDNPDVLVLQQRKESFLQAGRSEMEAGLHLPYAYSGVTPLVPGSYDVRVVLRNRACASRDPASCRKAYTLLDGEVDVPPPDAAGPRLSDVVLAYGVEYPPGPPVYRPYRFGNAQILPNPRRVYAIGDPLVVLAEPLGAPAGSVLRYRLVARDDDGRVVAEKSQPVPDVRVGPLFQELPLEGVVGGRYRVLVELVDAAGAVRDTKTADFDVTPRTAVARPGIRGSVTPIAPEVPGLVSMALADQYLALERRDEARALLEDAVRRNPKLGPARERLATLALEDGDAERVVELLEPVYREVPDRVELLLLLGEAYARTGDDAAAVELLEKAIRLRRPRPRILNVLAASYYRLGDRARAREALERSLELDADQPSIRELLGRIEKEEAGAAAAGAPPPKKK